METKSGLKKMNLIPSEMAVPARAVRLAKLINRASTFFALILLVAVLVTGGLFFYFSSQSAKQVATISNLKVKINNLQQNEQKLVLAKDRLVKISAIQQLKSISSEITRFNEFANLISTSGSILNEASLSSKGTEATLLSDNSDKLAEILKPIDNFVNYKKVVLTSLNYNPGTGFVSTIFLGRE